MPLGIVLAGTNLCNHADGGLSQMHDSSKSPCRDPGFQAGVDRNIVIVDRDCFRSLAEHPLDEAYAGKGWRDENTVWHHAISILQWARERAAGSSLHLYNAFGGRPLRFRNGQVWAGTVVTFVYHSLMKGTQ